MSLLALCHNDLPLLSPTDTVEAAITKFRREGLPHRVIYLYVVDEEGKLVGVVPTRLLLTSPPHKTIGEVVIRKVVSLRDNLLVDDARRAFAEHRFLAFPVVNEQNQLVGVIDIEKFAVDLGNVNERTRFDDVYELLGLQDMHAHGAWKNFQMRFPWLLTTFFAGILAAVMSGFFEMTLQKTLVLAFFPTLILGLNEAVAMQAATLSLQWFHKTTPDLKNLCRFLVKELTTASLLSFSLGGLAGIVSYVWRGELAPSLVIAAALSLSLALSCFWGIVIPFILKKCLGESKLAAAPLTLAIADLTSLGIYFGLSYRFL